MRSCNYDAFNPDLINEEAEITIDRISEERGNLPGVSISANLKGQLVGVCEAHSLANWGTSPESNMTIALGPFEVEEPFQGQGWGRFLMQTALFEGQQIGYRHAVTSTGWRNYRALLFYTNYGFDDLDTAYSFLKELQ